MKKRLDPGLIMLLVMIGFGTLPLFVRRIALSSPELALCRAVIAAALLGLYLLATASASRSAPSAGRRRW